MNARVYLLAQLLCHLSGDDWDVRGESHIVTATEISKMLNGIPPHARVIALQKKEDTMKKPVKKAAPKPVNAPAKKKIANKK